MESSYFYNNDDEDDDEEYTIAITPVLPTVEPDNSLSMGDEHLSTIPKTESDEVIKSRVKDLVPILSESEGISDDTCDVPFCDNYPPLDVLNDDFEILLDSNDDYSSSDDDSLYSEDIDYVDASPPDSELVSLEEVKDFDPEDGEIDTDISSYFKEDILCGKYYEAFFCDSEPDSRDFTMDVVEDIFDNPTREPRVHVPNVLPTHPTLYLDSDFTLSIQSKRFLSPDEFSISFIRDPPFPVIDTLLPFSSENENKVVNHGILDVGEEKSPHLLLHRGFKAFQLISESPMMIYGGDIPKLDVSISPDYEASRACGFVHRSLKLHILGFIMGIEYPNPID
ncbi:hypothetical protein Tco_0269742 [Tanacetum coccineum]